MKSTFTLLTTAVIILLMLPITLVFAQQPDSVYFYSNGQKDWYHIQKDVYAFRAINGQQYTGNYDPAIVEKIAYKNNSPRKISEVHFKQGATEIQKNVEKNKIRNHPEFECEYPVLTKEPTKDKSFSEYQPTDDLLLVAFKDPITPTAIIQQFKVQNDLILEREPVQQLPKSQSWTYSFRVPKTKCGSENAVDIAKKIWESADSAILKFIIPNILLVRKETFFKLPTSVNFPPDPFTTTCYDLHNDYNRWQWWTENDGTITYLNQGGNTSTADADADICDCWSLGYKGNGVKIAVIDFHGYEFTHQDINGQFLNGWNTTTNTPLVTTIINDTDYHAMSVSGILSAIGDNNNGILGVAYQAKIIPILFDGWNDEITLGLQKAVEFRADVINMSWVNTGFPQSVTNEITNAFESGRPDQWNSAIKYGCVMVAGAGNSSFQTPRYPAAYPEVIGVGGSNPNDFRSTSTDGWGWPSGGSNYGPYYDVVAPSSFLRSLRWMGSGTGSTLQTNYDLDLPGTSFGTAIVSGITAMLLQKNPQLYASEIKTALRNGADKVNSSFYNYNEYTSEPGRNSEMQFGRVNCLNSLNNIPVGITQLPNNSALLSAYYDGQDHLILKIDFDDNKNNVFVLIYDVLGKEILRTEIPAVQNQKNISINTFPTGMYLLSVFSKDGIKIGSDKFVKY